MRVMTGVSVVIATYNRAGMVAEAIQAALAQTRPPEEIVVSDDCSTDNTFDVLTGLSRTHPKIRIVRQPVNTGGVPNWNLVIHESQGRYIAWCSDDDRFLPDHLEASVRYLEDHPEAGMVHSSFVDSLETEGAREIRPRPLRSTQPIVIDRRNLLRYMIRYYDWPFHPSTIVMRRSVWQQVGSFDKRYALADTDWFVRVVEKYPVALLPRHGVLNRRHAGNWSNRVGSARMQAEILEIVERSIDRLKRAPLERMFCRSVWRWNVRLRLLLTLYARACYGHGDAAGAAWLALLDRTGQPGPWLGLKPFVNRCGRAFIQLLASAHRSECANSVNGAGPTISPL